MAFDPCLTILANETAAAAGSWIPVKFYLGRRGTVFVSAIFCLLTSLGGAFARSWQQPFIIKAVLGIGMGLKGATVPVGTSAAFLQTSIDIVRTKSQP